MAKSQKKAVASWKITFEVSSIDAGSYDDVTTTITMQGDWESAPRAQGGPLDLIACDMGAIVKMIDDSGKIVPGGDAVEGFQRGFGGADG